MLSKKEIVAKAKEFCRTYDVVNYPVTIVDLCKQQGIDVFEEYLTPEVSGFIVVQPEEHKKYKSKKFIVVNLSDLPARRRFTIAHELAHFILHKQEEDTLYAHRDAGQNGGIETEANILASNILLPENLVKTAYENSVETFHYSSIRMIEYIALQFAVSYHAAEVRLKELKLI